LKPLPDHEQAEEVMTQVRDPFTTSNWFPGLQARLDNARRALFTAEAAGRFEEAMSLRLAVSLLEDLLDEERRTA
jgi:hypothetical protein